MKKIWLVLLVLGLVISFSFTGLAYKAKPARPFFVQTNPLALSEEQQEELKDMREEYFEARQEITEELKDKQKALKEAIAEWSVVDMEILKEEINNLQRDLLDLRTSYLEDIKNILSDEQWEKLTDYDFTSALRARKFGSKPGPRGRQPQYRGPRF